MTTETYAQNLEVWNDIIMLEEGIRYKNLELARLKTKSTELISDIAKLEEQIKMQRAEIQERIKDL